jgi:hypothetical protein
MNNKAIAGKPNTRLRRFFVCPQGAVTGLWSFRVTVMATQRAEDNTSRTVFGLPEMA